MRVLFVTCGLTYGGAERIIEALALDLKQEGHEVEVAATTRDGPIGVALRARGIAVHVLGLRSALDLRIPFRLAALEARFQPQIVHSHLAVADITSAAASGCAVGWRVLGRLKGRRGQPPSPRGPIRLTTVHNPGLELSPFKRMLWQRALGRMRRIIAVSEAVRTSPALAPWPDVEVQRPSLVDVLEPEPIPSRRDAARAALDVGPLDYLVLGVGRLTPIKGYDVLAQAAALMKSTKRRRIMVVGGGPEAERLRSMGLELLGPREDAASLLGAADVVACPSRSEGFPQVPLLAYARRVPVVASAVGGLAETVQDGVTGLLVPPNDPEAFAAALDRVADEPNLAKSMGTAAHAWLLGANLTRAAMTRQTRETYEGLINPVGSRDDRWI
ncbi:MAG: glycosyltransferase [Deltaproteobacteria bacterium]|nr:glycosyltransferase [Deltaproteobacteria bacterium]